MESILEKLGSLAGDVKEYIDNRITLLKLEAVERASKLIALIIAVAALAVFVFLFLMFVGLVAAVLISNWTGLAYMGYLVVALGYVLFGMLLWRKKEKLIRIPLMNAILKQIFSDEDVQKH
jgi:hypothetical protein